MQIGKTKIGDNHPVYFVAEMSGNHNGDKDVAINLIRAAKEMGANAIKLQTYSADSITLNVRNKDFLLPQSSSWSNYDTLWNLYNKACTPFEWHQDLFAEANNLGLEIFSTPFDENGVKLLENLNVSAYKIASPEINHIPLIELVAKTNKPIILSTGVADLKDINLAIETIRKYSDNPKIILLKCNSAYPTPYEDSNLKTITDLKERFNVIPGYSDHTIGTHCVLASVSLGAKLIEKHFCINGLETVDSFFSIVPDEFREMVQKVRDLEKALGSVSYEVSKSAHESINGRRSIYVSKNIKPGDEINRGNIKCVRPSFGLEPKYFNKVIGKKAKKQLQKGDRLTWDVIE
jgi:pseudaminic acid synthase